MRPPSGPTPRSPARRPPRQARAPARLPALTGLRFAAALGVFVFHAWLAAVPAPGPGPAALPAKAGWAGVSFFFVLSGFVLAFSARCGDTARRFWRRRAAKVYPSHLATALAAFAVAGAAGDLPAPGTAAVNLLLLHAWVPSPQVFVSGNPVSWSLSAEVLFYALFPALWSVLSRIRPRHLWAAAGAAAGSTVCLPAAVPLLLPAGPALPMPDGTPGLWHYWAVYVLPAARLPEFVLGMLLARIVREGRWRGPGPAPAAALAVLACALATCLPYLYGLAAATVVPLALVVGAVADAGLRGRTGRAGHPAAVRLGELSFAFYLVHRPVVVHVHRALDADGRGPIAEFLVILLSFLVALMLSWLLHQGLEKPVMRRWGTRGDGRGKHSAISVTRPSRASFLARCFRVKQP
ncbi:acyltransferase [Streptomyces sp. NPDC052309]|uniref:acyltransferase family protein n=1 Tax=Streptomyces sp. NPDC052309 TaxID=3155421 RepID=UPI00342FE3E6